MKSQLHLTAGKSGQIFSTYLHATDCTNHFVEKNPKKSFQLDQLSFKLGFQWLFPQLLKDILRKLFFFFPNRVHGGHTASWTSYCSKPACVSLDRVVCCRKREVPAAKCWLG